MFSRAIRKFMCCPSVDESSLTTVINHLRRNKHIVIQYFIIIHNHLWSVGPKPIIAHSFFEVKIEKYNHINAIIFQPRAEAVVGLSNSKRVVFPLDCCFVYQGTHTHTLTHKVRQRRQRPLPVCLDFCDAINNAQQSNINISYWQKNGRQCASSCCKQPDICDGYKSHVDFQLQEIYGSVFSSLPGL